MKSRITKEDYYTVEQKFYTDLEKRLRSNLMMYCVTGSLSRDDVIPGWSDIDTLIVVKSYSLAIMKIIGDCIKRYSKTVKIGTTVYQLDEFNYSLFNDPKTHNITQLILNQAISPRLLARDVKLQKTSKLKLVQLNRTDVTKQLHLLKREFIKLPANEPAIYKLISNILRNLLLQQGIMAEGYSAIWSEARKHLKGFKFASIQPSDIMYSASRVDKRMQQYYKLLNWLTHYRYV